MAKKGSGDNYKSKGERSNTSKKLQKEVRRDYIENRGIERAINQVKAWRQGKNVMLTVANPSKAETNKPFLRKSAREVWGSPFNKPSTK